MNTILLSEAEFRRDVVVEKDNGPTCLVALLEWTKTVCRKAEGNVMFIGEVEGWVALTSGNNSLEQSLIMRSIENILDNARFVHVLHSIAHLLRMCSILRHSLKLRNDREIIKIFVWLSINPVACFLAVGAFSKIFVWSSKANTAVDATAVSYRLESSK